jgi:hypothetical protein
VKRSVCSVALEQAIGGTSMKASLRWLSAVAFCAVSVSVAACAATRDASEWPTASDGSGGASTGQGEGGADLTGEGGSTSSGLDPAGVGCPEVAQEIIILDFRSGWWSGGGGGQFYDVALSTLAETCGSVSVEYHHFEVALRVKCLFGPSIASGCQEINEPAPSTPDGLIALFEKPNWNDYTQIWVLSGSEFDATDVALTGQVFEHFLGQTKGSCIPVLIGAGDGFVTHGNAVTSGLGIGQVFSTEFVQPGFFSVAFDAAVNVDSRMYAGSNLASHVLFQGVDSIADTVSNSAQFTHGDSIAEGSPSYQVIAHDSNGRPAIAIGAIELPDDGDRPFIIDAGFQRYYGMQAADGTRTLLQNMAKYLGNVGCKADIPK